MGSEYEQQGFDEMRKFMAEMSPARRESLDRSFKIIESGNFEDLIQPPMRDTSFGGSVYFSTSRAQVELDGEFSRDDLFRIALVMD